MQSIKILVMFFVGLGFVRGQLEVEQITVLPESMNETSGLIYFNDALITHNDSGNSTELFEFDETNGEIIRTVNITNATNIDWEDLAQDENYIYIGDFGNNTGDRQDLVIYRVDKQEYITQNQVTATSISFVYEDQSEFTGTPNSDWDAEALFCMGDNLYVLTKEWQSLQTRLYRLPKLEGSASAELIEQYDIDGLVTGAVYNEEQNQLVVVGYSTLLFPFVLLADQVSSTGSFFEEVDKIELDIVPLQVEAIAALGSTYYMTSELFVNAAFGITSTSRLFSFQQMRTEEPILPTEGNDLRLALQREEGIMDYILSTSEPILGVAIFDSSGRELYTSRSVKTGIGEIDVSIFSSGIYYVRFFLNGGEITKAFIKF